MSSASSAVDGISTTSVTGASSTVTAIAPPRGAVYSRVPGFELQARSEAGGRSDAVLTDQELRDITWNVLHQAGFKPSGADAELLSKIVTAATRRMVLIAPRGDEGYGFDVRSLQELMAAMHLTTGPLDVITHRLRIAAAGPHWRNTWIFAAGHLFSVPPRAPAPGTGRTGQSIDHSADGRLGSIVPVGPRLALDLIDDGVARSLPKWRDRLIACGLRMLWEPEPADLLDRILIMNERHPRTVLAEYEYAQVA